MASIFTQVGTVVVAAAACALGVRALRLPPLIGYVLAGIALGPLGFDAIRGGELLRGMQQIGISLLLFLVGLELDFTKAKRQLGSAFLIAGIQVLLAASLGTVLAVALGQGAVTGLYLGAALAFSSTVIVVKFLSGSKDLHSLHGRLTVGALVIEDLIALLVIIVAGGLSGSSALSPGFQLALLAVKAGAALGIIWFVAAYILPPLFARIARSAELLFVCSLAWCFALVGGVGYLGLSVEMGAFLAGISLASLPYALEIVNRLRSLRDFFVVMFFVYLGTTMLVPGPAYLVLTLAMVGVASAGKPVISFFTLTAHGYKVRTAFLTAVTLSQLSEFALIIVGIGVARGQLPVELGSAVTAAMVLSVLVSTVLFGQRNRLFSLLAPFLQRYERRSRAHKRERTELDGELKGHIVLFGYHRMGYHILKKLRELGHHAVVVDFNPDTVHRLRSQQVDAVYGDAEDDEVYEAVRAATASLVISTIPHQAETEHMIGAMKRLNAKGKLIVTGSGIEQALKYYGGGADYVIMPQLLSGEHVAEIIGRAEDKSLGHFLREQKHQAHLMQARSHALYLD